MENGKLKMENGKLKTEMESAASPQRWCSYAVHSSAYSPRRGDISLTPYKAARSDAAVWGRGMPRVPARGTGGRYGRTPRVMPRKRETNYLIVANHPF